MHALMASTFFLLQQPSPVLHHRRAELARRQARLRQSGQKNKYTTSDWTAKLVVTAQRQRVFHSMSLYFYIKY